MDIWTLEVELEKKQIYLEERILEKEKKFADLGSWTLEISTSWIYLGKGILEKIIYKTNIIYIEWLVVKQKNLLKHNLSND